MIALALLAGCGSFADDSWWVDQLEPASPCYDVNLADGLDESSTDELHDLFACVNRFGHVDALAGLDAALDAPTRAATPAGLEVVALVSGMLEADLDVFAVAGVLLEALRAPDRPVTEILDLTLELGWGDRANRVRTGVVALDDPAATAAGILTPLRPVLPTAARALLEDPNDPVAFAGELLEDPETERWLLTFVAGLETSDPTVVAALDGLLVDAGSLIAATRSPENDRWPAATGDSLRDLAEFFLVRQDPVVDQISPAVDAMLSDPLVRQGTVPVLADLAEAGHLAAIPGNLAWLAESDVDGRALGPGELSALYRFVRLLADHNHRVDCSIDVLGFPILQWSFGNLAVSTLELIAGLDPGDVQDLAQLVSDLTGGPVTEELLSLAVSTGVCPDLNQEALDDLRALETVTGPEAESLLTGLVMFLHVLQQGDSDHIPALADLAEALFDANGLEPAEEILRDIGSEPLVDDLVALVPVMLDPEAHGIAPPNGEPAADLRDLVDLAQWLFHVDPDNGLTGTQRIRPLVVPLIAQDGAWVAIGNLGALMSDDRTTVSQALPLVPRVVAIDPDLTLIRQLGPILADPALSGPFLRLLETSAIIDAVLADPSPGGDEVPLPFWGRLVVTGALEDLLSVVDTVIDGL